MSRVCKNFEQCEKILIDDQGVIRNHPNKVINDDSGVEWMCDECVARIGTVKTGAFANLSKGGKAKPKEETQAEPKKKASKKGGEKK